MAFAYMCTIEHKHATTLFISFLDVRSQFVLSSDTQKPEAAVEQHAWGRALAIHLSLNMNLLWVCGW